MQNLSRDKGFGMPGRKMNEGDYTYGFNGMENDNEIKYNGNSIDFGDRMYDSRLGRWQAMDPLASKYPSLNPYNFVANSPLMYIDPDGRKIVFAENSSDDYKKKTLAHLQKLTNHKLELRGNEVVIAKNSGANDGKSLEIGTKLIKEVIDSDFTATLSETTDGHNGVDSKRKDDSVNEPRDVVISFDANKTVVFTDENKNEYGTLTVNEEGRLETESIKGSEHISLAHEPLHSTRMMGEQPAGQHDYNQDSGQYHEQTIANPDKDANIGKVRPKITKEEMLTRTQENAIRDEQGFNRRSLGSNKEWNSEKQHKAAKSLFMKN